MFQLQAVKFNVPTDQSLLGSPRSISHSGKLPRASFSFIDDVSGDVFDALFLLVGEEDSLIFVEKGIF